MKQIDRLHLEMPFAGSRMLRDLVALAGIKVGCKHVKTLLKCMGIEALYRKPRTTRKHPQHPVYPYLLRGLTIDRAKWMAKVAGVIMYSSKDFGGQLSTKKFTFMRMKQFRTHGQE